MQSVNLCAIAILLVGASAADVYTIFEDSNGKQIGSDHYDVGNPACFQVTGATQIVFQQAGSTSNPNGPYCLTAWSDSGCTSFVANQQFTGPTSDGEPIDLNSDLDNQSYWTWGNAKC